MEIGRRGFVAGAAAMCVACAACGDDDDEATGSASTSSSMDPGLEQPPLGFGSTVDVGALDDLLDEIDAGDGFRYVPEARAYLVRYPPEALEAARQVYDDETLVGIEAGIVALYQKCTHLGCRVPECTSSGRFECPCHGAVFNGVGEYVGGPAPRGLDRFAVAVEGGRVLVDTSTPLQGLPVGVTTVESDEAGPSCIQPGG